MSLKIKYFFYNITFFKRFLNVESVKLDLVIKRCKRLTGVLIILKKLA
jgi:hypothetical protein